jgi:ribosome-associated protein
MAGSVPTIDELRPWIDIQFSRSSGPGGQNVNKLNTRVTLLLDVDACTVLSDVVKSKIRACLGSRFSRDGRLRVVSLRHRTQLQNRAAAEERLIAFLGEAFRTRTKRKRTERTPASRVRRLADKRREALRKRERRQTGQEREETG